MALFKPSTWGIVKVWRDIENYRDFIRVIKKEKANKDSKFNKWKLNHNYFYTIYFTHDIEETENQLPEHIKRLRMFEQLAPVHRYFDEELGFAECLTPEFNQFINDDDTPTLTYLITYRFSFNKISLWWFVKWAAIITGIILILTSAWFSKILTWVGTLI